MGQQAFVLRLDHRLDDALKMKKIGVGWSKLPNLSESTDWDVLQRSLVSKYPELYKGKARALGNASGSLWRFIHEMQPGDLVVVPVSGSPNFYVAKVTSKLKYDPDGGDLDLAWYRSVEWLTKKPLSRLLAHNRLQKRMKARQTCVGAHDLLDEIDEARSRKKPLAFNDSVIELAGGGVAKSLDSAINDYGLEQVVAMLARSTGADAKVLPKRSKHGGDADVLATYDLKVGNQESTVEVLYQVKQHQGKTGPKGIQQLIDRMEEQPGVVRGCLVTTADELTDDAYELAERNDIIVLTRNELVAWILMVGLSALNTRE